MKVAGYTAAGAAIYLASSDEPALRKDLTELALTTRILDGTPYAFAVRVSELPFLAALDAELQATGLTPQSLL